MRRCKGCGGILGRDCFNEIDCEWISYSQEQYKEQSRDYVIQQLQNEIQNLIQEINTLKKQIKLNIN